MLLLEIKANTMDIIIAVMPVLLFLILLFMMDSYKLVKSNILIICFIWGLFSAALSYFTNTGISEINLANNNFLTRYIFPVIEETAKSLVVLVLINKRKIGFHTDAAIYGFSVGSGFALFENIFYLYNYPDSGILTWILRGLGTAVMHGGTTSILAIMMIVVRNANTKKEVKFITAYILAFCIHSFYNHFLLSPIYQTVLILFILPLFYAFLFYYNNKQLQNWLEAEFNSEIELLKCMKEGKFGSTRQGEYLKSIQDKFKPESLLDIYCYLITYLELSVKAKRNMMLRECGLPIIIEDDLQDKIKELKELKKNIGKLGELTISPLIRLNHRDIWKINTLNK